jgi:hypothetical protein
MAHVFKPLIGLHPNMLLSGLWSYVLYVSIGLISANNRKIAALRSAKFALGMLTSRSKAISRTVKLATGLKTSANKMLSKVIAAKIGILAIRYKGQIKRLANLVGLLPVATRIVSAKRKLSAAVGFKMSVRKAISRIIPAKIGFLSFVHQHTSQIILLLSLGMLAARTKGSAKSPLAAKIGLKIVRNKLFGRTVLAKIAVLSIYARRLAKRTVIAPLIGTSSMANVTLLPNHLLRSLTTAAFTGLHHTAKFISRLIF